MDVDAVFRPKIDTSLSPTALDDFEMASLAENPVFIDEKQDRENSLYLLPLPTTPAPRDQPNPSVNEKSPFSNRS